jgi:hypothetical protein
LALNPSAKDAVSWMQSRRSIEAWTTHCVLQLKQELENIAASIMVAIADPIEQESRDADSKEPIDLPLAA